MDYNPRQQRHRGEPKNHPHHLLLPVHRALCWWHRGESCQKHFNGQFIFLWVAFGAANWQEKGHKAKHQANTALTKLHTDKIIEWVLIRLYTLRNQIIYGGATWNSNVNRSQLNDGARRIIRCWSRGYNSVSAVSACLSVMYMTKKRE